ncbi:MAG: TonB C-terminal domain-containing protein [Deltaproteobacteria bacterium]|nr:MAG: TonB C-terminal domain-containing protein [Deltaproteobacteria bacterium]
MYRLPQSDAGFDPRPLGLGDLEVTVRFGIQENGEITGLKIVKRSGDPSYDDSVFRAVSKANPLPPPPESYRKDFMDVELTFRPKDLAGG